MSVYASDAEKLLKYINDTDQLLEFSWEDLPEELKKHAEICEYQLPPNDIYSTTFKCYNQPTRVRGEALEDRCCVYTDEERLMMGTRDYERILPTDKNDDFKLSLYLIIELINLITYAIDVLAQGSDFDLSDIEVKKTMYTIEKDIEKIINTLNAHTVERSIFSSLDRMMQRSIMSYRNEGLLNTINDIVANKNKIIPMLLSWLRKEVKNKDYKDYPLNFFINLVEKIQILFQNLNEALNFKLRVESTPAGGAAAGAAAVRTLRPPAVAAAAAAAAAAAPPKPVERRSVKRKGQEPLPEKKAKTRRAAVEESATARGAAAREGETKRARSARGEAAAAAAPPSPEELIVVENIEADSGLPTAYLYPRPPIKTTVLCPPYEPSVPFEDAPCYRRPTGELKDYQKDVVQYLLKNPYCPGLIVAHGTGTGKTEIIMATIKCILGIRGDIKAMVIMPKGVVAKFMKELIIWGLNPFYDSGKIIPLTIKQFAINFSEGKINCENTLLIVDEAHLLKSDISPKTMYQPKGKEEKKARPKGLHAAQLLKCAISNNKSGFHKVILLTGTPMAGGPMDAINLLNIIDGIYLAGKEKSKLTKKINALYPKANKAPVEGPARQKLISELINIFNCRISIFPCPSGENYPTRQDWMVDIEMPPIYLANYLKAETNKLGNKRKASGKLLKDNFFINLRQQVTSIQGVNNPKIKWVLNHIEKERKTMGGVGMPKIILYNFFLPKGLDLFQKALQERGINTILITGHEGSEERERLVQEWSSIPREENNTVFLISGAGGTGLDFKNVDQVIITEPYWDMATLEQIAGRGIRFVHGGAGGRIVKILFMRLLKPIEIAINKAMASGGPMPPMEEYIPSVDMRMWETAVNKQENINTFTNEVLIPSSLQADRAKCYSKTTWPTVEDMLREST